MNNDKNISANGINFIIQEEGLVLHIYPDQLSLPSIGVGHLITSAEKQSGIFKNGITKDHAIELLKKDIVKAQNIIKSYIKVELNQNQFDALSSLIFNCGGSPVITGTLGKVINAGNFADVPAQMEAWCHGNGKVLPVLQKRRKREIALFQKPVDNIIPANVVVPAVQEEIMGDIRPLGPLQGAHVLP